MSGFRLATEWFIVFLVMMLCFVKKRHIRPFFSLFLVIFVTLFALLSPAGKILITVRSFKITQDALFLGLHKSAVLIGMVYISKTIVSYRIRLPGALGAFIRDIFSYYAQFTSQPLSIKKGNLINMLDTILLSVWQANIPK